MKTKISIIYHSGYGHTAKVANAVAEGAKSVVGCETNIINVEKLNDSEWAILDESDAIIFGSPTYMGSVSAKLKEFMEKASGRWMQEKWKNKIGAGFTNSGGLSGDKQNVIIQLFINAMQHGMIWVGFAEKPPAKTGNDQYDGSEINRLSSYSGLMTQSNNDSPEVTPPSGDLETAIHFGKRVAMITMQFIAGKKNN